MSYTPTIIVNFSDLHTKENEIVRNCYDESIDEDSLQANQALRESILAAREYGYVKFPKHKLNLVIILSDLTSRNADIRELLDELEIEYQIDN